MDCLQSRIATQSGTELESTRKSAEQLQWFGKIGTFDGEDPHIAARWRCCWNHVDTQSLLSQYQGNVLSHVTTQSRTDSRYSRFRHSLSILYACYRLVRKICIFILFIFSLFFFFSSFLIFFSFISVCIWNRCFFIKICLCLNNKLNEFNNLSRGESAASAHFSISIFFSE